MITKYPNNIVIHEDFVNDIRHVMIKTKDGCDIGLIVRMLVFGKVSRCPFWIEEPLHGGDYVIINMSEEDLSALKSFAENLKIPIEDRIDDMICALKDNKTKRKTKFKDFEKRS